MTALWGRTPRQRLNDWFEQRRPRGDTWELRQDNLYILPTRAGWGFCGTLVVMLLASINYQLNLGYSLTFLLGGAALVSMHQTHGNLRRLRLHLRPPAPVFAGEAATLEVVIDNPGAERHALGLGLNRAPAGPPGLALALVDVPAQGSGVARLRLPAPRRGEHPLPALRLQSQFPLGLFRAWTVWRPAATLLVYPAPERPAPPLPPGLPDARTERPQRHGAGGEFDGVRAHRRGDTLRQVVWKKFARSGELVSRDVSGSSSATLELDWAASAGAPPAGRAVAASVPAADGPVADPALEGRLQRLAAWVLLADQAGLAYGLQLPGLRLPREAGSAQREAALQALARWGGPASRPAA